MRRPRELGMVAGLLLGLSGCAGLPGQANYRAAADRSSIFDRSEGPLSRVASFWRRPRAEVLEDEAPAGASARRAVAETPPLVVRNEDTEAPEATASRPRLFRHFPRLSRLWNRGGADGPGTGEMSEETSGSSLAGTATVTTNRAKAPSSRPSAPTSGAAIANRGAKPARSSSSATPSRDLAFDWPDRGNRPQVDPAMVPVRNTNSNASADAAPLAPPLAGRLLARSPQEAPSAKPGAAPGPGLPLDELPVPELPPARPAPVSGPPAAPASAPAPVRAPMPAPASQPVPQPTLPKENQPVPPSPSMNEAEPPIVSEPGMDEAAAPRSGQVWSTWPASPLPVEQHEILPSAQGYLPTSGCVDSCGPKCKVRHKICPLKKRKMVDSCDGPAPVKMKVKKQCFLKRWLHKSTCSGGECGCVAVADGCGTHAPIAIASPQLGEVVAPAPSGQW